MVLKVYGRNSVKVLCAAALALIVSSCGGGGGNPPTAPTVSQTSASQAQRAALQEAHGDAVRAINRLRADTTDATRAEISAAEAAVRALDAALAAATDVTAADRARYASAALRADLAAASAEALRQIRSRESSSQAQLAALQGAYGNAVRALNQLRDDTRDATRADISAAEAAVRALDAALAAATDVTAAERARFASATLEAELAAARTEALAHIRSREANARRDQQMAAINSASNARDTAMQRLEGLGSAATNAEITDAETALAREEAAIAAAADISDEIKSSLFASTSSQRLRLESKKAVILNSVRARTRSQNYVPRNSGWHYGPAWQHKSPAVSDLFRASDRGGFEIRSGRWRDPQGRDGSTSAARMAEYFNSVARVELQEDGDVLRFRDFGSRKVVRVSDNATQEERAALRRALQNINEVLPYDKQLRWGSDIPRLVGPISVDEFDASFSDGEVHVHFAEKVNWPYDYDMDRYNAAGLGRVTNLTCVDQSCVKTRIGGGMALIDRNARNDRDDLVTHELLHALGIMGHVEISRFPDAILAPHNQDSTTLDLSSSVEGKALFVIATNRVGNGTRWADVTASSFGHWEQDAFHLLGWADTGGGNGDIQFGVSWANGLATPWAFSGAPPNRKLHDNPALSGRAAWRGALLAVDTKGDGIGRTVVGDTEISIELASLRGRADFTGLESWSTGTHPGTAGNGEIWEDGDLRYAIEVLDHQDGEYFTGSNVSSTDDPGFVAGIFVGQSHQGTVGKLEHPGLTGAFGALRE